jgi:hypothetical protein
LLAATNRIRNGAALALTPIYPIAGLLVGYQELLNGSYRFSQLLAKPNFPNPVFSLAVRGGDNYFTVVKAFNVGV